MAVSVDRSRAPSLPDDGVQLRVLGPLEVRRAAEPTAALPGRLRRVLAALLVAPGAVVPVDRLVDVVWGQDIPDDPAAALHNLIARLRNRLSGDGPAQPPVSLITRSPGYVLDVGRDVLDATSFEDLATDATSVLTERPDVATGLFERALALWRGPAYAEFADEDFARPEAARLEELRLSTVENLAESLLLAGRHELAAAQLQAVVASGSLRERPHLQLMLAHYRAGRQADALGVARDYRDRLADELGLDPSPAVQRLQDEILRQDERLAWRPRTAALAAAPGIAPSVAEPGAVRPEASGDAAGNVRQPAHDLIGRDEHLAELHGLLGPGVLVTLTGPGGVGKTSLARKALAEAASRFEHGGVFVELAAVDTGDAVAPAVSTALQVQPRQDVAVIDRLVDTLRGREVCVVLDNCEHVLDDVAVLVEAVLRSCPRVAILATSHAPLDLPLEQVWVVPPLPTPPIAADLAATQGTPAVQLFAQRAAARVRGFELDADNTAHVAEICRRLDGLPLAIELAAARMGAMTPADLAARLSWRFRLLRGGDRTAAARHRTLRAVVDWSYDLLDEPSRRVFEALSIFAGGFGLLDAERLLDRLGLLGDPSGGPDPDGLAIVLSLVDRSLVTVVGRKSTNAASTTTYVLLDTMRTYGRERLAARGLLEQAQRAHADVFSTIAGEAGTHLYREGHAAAAERLGGAIDELRAAWGWAVNADLSLAARLVSGMAPYVEHRMPAEVGQWAECTLAAVEDTDANRPDLAGVYAVAAACARFSGDLARGRQAAERGLAIADDVDTAGYLRFLLCEVALFEGRLDDVQALASTVAAVEPTAAVAGMVAVTAPLATAYAGDVTTALQRAEAMYAMSERTGPDVLRAWATFVLGEVALDVDPDRARQLFVAALHQSRLLGDRYLSGVALVAAAAVESRHADDPARAIPLFREVVEHWRAAGDWVHQWTTLRNVADLLVRLGVDEEAALLHGALSATDRGPIFGADAERMTAMRQVLEARLGADALAELTSRGGRLGDGDVLTVAQRALAEAARRRSDVASTSL